MTDVNKILRSERPRLNITAHLSFIAQQQQTETERQMLADVRITVIKRHCKSYRASGDTLMRELDIRTKGKKYG